jgi:hypothetical protein
MITCKCCKEKVSESKAKKIEIENWTSDNSENYWLCNECLVEILKEVIIDGDSSGYTVSRYVE